MLSTWQEKGENKIFLDLPFWPECDLGGELEEYIGIQF